MWNWEIVEDIQKCDVLHLYIDDRSTTNKVDKWSFTINQDRPVVKNLRYRIPRWEIDSHSTSGMSIFIMELSLSLCLNNYVLRLSILSLYFHCMRLSKQGKIVVDKKYSVFWLLRGLLFRRHPVLDWWLLSLLCCLFWIPFIEGRTEKKMM